MTGTELLHQAIRSGLQMLQSGNPASAIATFRTALGHAPDHPGLRNLLGVALLDIGEHSAALREFEHAAQFAKSDPAILGNLAEAYAELGRHAEAQQVFRKASRLEPRTLRYAQGMAIALAQQGKTAEAEPLLQRLTERFPDASSPWYNLGNICREQQRWRDAETCYREALRREPDDADARNNLGSTLHSQLRYDEAIAEYLACINTNPDAVAVRLNLASALMDAGRFKLAADACRDLLSRAPDSAEAHRFLAAALGHQGNVIDALPSFARAAALAPADPLSQRAYGGALAEAGQMHRALRVLGAVEKLQPGADARQQILSAVLLAQGMLTDGWCAYRRRPAYLRFAEKLGADTLSQQLPAGVSGKHILVLREQGLGDELFFLRFAPQLQALGAKVTVRASSKIAPLVARAHCADAILTDDALPDSPPDMQILCGDLPYALNVRSTSPVDPDMSLVRCRDFALRIAVFSPLPPASLRIAPLPEVVAAIRQRLRGYGEPPYLGLTWRAGTAAHEQLGGQYWALSKELPLPPLAAAVREFRGTLLALQRNPAPGELDSLAATLEQPLHDCTDLNEDLEGMLALLSLIDDYVGVSNTNMHLRAAAGGSARVLAPSPAEWRWMAGGGNSPWFPGFSIYRQSPRGDWRNAIQSLAGDLRTLPFA